MKNKKLAAIFIAALGVSFTLGSVSGQKITAELKNQGIINKGSRLDKEVISYKGTTYVPLREFSTMLGENVTYKDGLIYLGEISDSTYNYNNPAPIGTTQTTTARCYRVDNCGVEVSVTEVLRGEAALEKIESTKSLVIEPKEHEEFLLAKIKVKVLSMENPGPFLVDKSSFVIFSENNTEYIIEGSTRVPEPVLDSSLNVGSTTEGYMIIRVNKNDPAPKIAMITHKGRTDTITNGAWFSLAN